MCVDRKKLHPNQFIDIIIFSFNKKQLPFYSVLAFDFIKSLSHKALKIGHTVYTKSPEPGSSVGAGVAGRTQIL